MNAVDSLTHLHLDYRRRNWLIRELRSNHAGETGAVWIYRGILRVTRDNRLRNFAERHLETESSHLVLMNQLLPAGDRSHLLPLWKVAGYLTGAIPALFGPRVVYVTINAVETFVEAHYEPQIRQLKLDGQTTLAGLLDQCRRDEAEHRREAEQLIRLPTGPGHAFCII